MYFNVLTANALLDLKRTTTSLHWARRRILTVAVTVAHVPTCIFFTFAKSAIWAPFINCVHN